jgi:hypothetical protein
MQATTEVIQNYDNKNVRNIGQDEARHRKYKGHNLDGGQVFDHSSDQTAVLANTTRDRL